MIQLWVQHTSEFGCSGTNAPVDDDGEYTSLVDEVDDCISSILSACHGNTHTSLLKDIQYIY